MSAASPTPAGAASANETSVACARPAARFEIKYLIAPARATALIQDLSAFLRPDPHALGPGRTYTVRTLYFDSPHRVAYREKSAGILVRAKYRIRTYAETPDVRFAEIKRRLNNRILKHRAVLTVEEYRSLLEGRAAGGGPLALHRFRQGMLGLNLRPLVCIEYRRQPFVHPAYPRLRVTFDTHVTAHPARSLEEPSPGCMVLPAGTAVLEIKFNGCMPHWVHMLVRKYSLTDTAYSKYCRGLDALVAQGIIRMAPGEHIAKFLDQFAPDFVPPVEFMNNGLGYLEVTSDQPVSVLALRLTRNQRGDILRPPVTKHVRLVCFLAGIHRGDEQEAGDKNIAQRMQRFGQQRHDT